MTRTIGVLSVLLLVVAPVWGYEPAGRYIASFLDSRPVRIAYWTTTDISEEPVYSGFQSAMIVAEDGSTEYYLQASDLISVEQGPAHPWNRRYVHYYYLVSALDEQVTVLNPQGEQIVLNLAGGQAVANELERDVIDREFREFSTLVGEYSRLQVAHRRSRWLCVRLSAEVLLYTAGIAAVFLIPGGDEPAAAVGKAMLIVGGGMMSVVGWIATVMEFRDQRVRVRRLDDLVAALETLSRITDDAE